MARKVKLKTNLGNIRTHTRHVFEEIAEKWAVYYAWGIGSSGEHAEGRALDFMTLTADKQSYRKAVGDAIADYLWRHRERLGVWYIIWYRRIISTNSSGYAHNRWTDYRGSNPHTDHVHVSFWDNPPTYRGPNGEDDEVTPQDIEKVAERASDMVLKRTDVVMNKSTGKPRALATHVSDIEDSQELFERRSQERHAALSKAISALASGMDATVRTAVEEALAEAVVNVDVNVRQGEDEA